MTTNTSSSKQALALANVFVQKLKAVPQHRQHPVLARVQTVLCASGGGNGRGGGGGGGGGGGRSGGSFTLPPEESMHALNAELTRNLADAWIVPDFRAKLAQAFADEFSFQFSEFSEYFTVECRWESPGDGGAANSRSVRIPWSSILPGEENEEEENEEEENDDDDDDDDDDDSPQPPLRKRKRETPPSRPPPPPPGSGRLRAHLDETMFVIPHARMESLFVDMPRILERFDAAYEKHERFRKQLMVWNKMRLDGVWQYEYSNVRARNLAAPMLPRSLFPLPPTEVYAPLCELLFGPPANVRPPPLLHWSLFEVNEGKLIGLNFDSPPQIARLPYHPYTNDFHKLDDAHYAVIMMLSSHDRVIKYYREPAHNAKQGKKVTNTENFKLRNGEIVIVPQRKRVCVTASQITKFNVGRQKYYFFVFYYGPRFGPAAGLA